MGYDPTQQVPPPQNYAPPGYLPQQPTYVPPQPAYTPPPVYPVPPSATGPYMQYAAQPTTGTGFNFSVFWQSVGKSGQAALLGGALLLVLFFLPWYSSPDPSGTIRYSDTRNDVTVTVSDSVTHPGWGVVTSGLANPIFDKDTGNANNTSTFRTSTTDTTFDAIYGYLWLVVVGALGLIAAAWLVSKRKMAQHLMTYTLIGVSAVSLVLEFSFLISINSEESDVEKSFSYTGNDNVTQHLAGSWYASAWAFWLALIVTGALLGVGIYLLMQERKAANPLAAQTYQQAVYSGSPAAAYPAAQTPGYQYPGSQPSAYPYPNQQQTPYPYPNQQPPPYAGQ